MARSEKLSSRLSGISGEYFVAAELSLRGFMASITLRNNDSIDIHASKHSNNKIFAIQVKTNQYGKRNWMMNEKAESNYKDNFFYVFVSLKGVTERPEYFIVPSIKVAEFIKSNYAYWIATPGRKGQLHNGGSMRKFIDNNGEYIEKWELLA
jgi:hypothetical protein